MDSDRHFKSKKDDRRKDRKKKSRSKSSASRSRSSSSRSSSFRKKKSKKGGHEESSKYSSKHKESRDEMPVEDPYKNMMGFPGYPMMPFDKKPQFEQMMPMPGMHRGFPHGFPMPGYPPMMRPPQYPPVIPPLPNQMDPAMMRRMGDRMAMKPFPDQKAAPLMKKEKEKSIKKEEETGKVLEFTPPLISAETLRSMHVSVKHLQEPLFLFTCKKILTDLEPRLKEKKLKSRAKEISEFLSTLYDKLKESEKKDKKKSGNSSHSTTSEGSKISELELLKALNEVENIKTLLSLVNLEKFSLDNCYEPDIIQIRESEESTALFEEARSLFSSTKGEMAQSS